ncbi:MAG: hypothetical protein ACI8UD_000516 [Planctomycetota bacterium]|jgi:hypothetical protein
MHQPQPADQLQLARRVTETGSTQPAASKRSSCVVATVIHRAVLEVDQQQADSDQDSVEDFEAGGEQAANERCREDRWADLASEIEPEGLVLVHARSLGAATAKFVALVYAMQFLGVVNGVRITKKSRLATFAG